MAFTALLPSQIGKEWSLLPASFVYFYYDLIVIYWEFDAQGNPVQPHQLFISTECCSGDGVDDNLFIYLQLYRRVRKRWELVPYTTVTAELGGDQVPSNISFFQHYPEPLTNCVGPQPPGCGPVLPVNTRLDFVEFNNQLAAWVASAENVFGVPTDNIIYDVDFDGCGIDRCDGRGDGWYIEFQFDPNTLLGGLLTQLGYEFDKKVIATSPPLYDSLGCWITEPTAWLINQAGNILLDELIQAGLQAITVRAPNPVLAVATFVLSELVESLQYELFLCGEPTCDPPGLTITNGTDPEDPEVTDDVISGSYGRPLIPSPPVDELVPYSLCIKWRYKITQQQDGARINCSTVFGSYFLPAPPVVTYTGISQRLVTVWGTTAGPPNVSIAEDVGDVPSQYPTSGDTFKQHTAWINAPMGPAGNVSLPPGETATDTSTYLAPWHLTSGAVNTGTWFCCTGFGASRTCQTFIARSAADIELEVISMTFGTAQNACQLYSPPCTREILIRRGTLSANPFTTIRSLTGGVLSDYVKVILKSDGCDYPPAQLYFTGLINGGWVLDVSRPSTNGDIVDLLGRSLSTLANPFGQTTPGTGSSAGLIPLVSEYVGPSGGITLGYTIISDTCSCPE